MIDLKTHEKYLILAQQKSQKSYGFNFPSSSVGCVIVDYFNNKAGKVISYGSTGIDGRPHAEEIALKSLNIAADICIYTNHKISIEKIEF